MKIESPGSSRPETEGLLVLPVTPADVRARPGNRRTKTKAAAPDRLAGATAFLGESLAGEIRDRYARTSPGTGNPRAERFDGLGTGRSCSLLVVPGTAPDAADPDPQNPDPQNRGAQDRGVPGAGAPDTDTPSLDARVAAYYRAAGHAAWTHSGLVGGPVSLLAPLQGAPAGPDAVEAFCEGLLLSAYRFDRYRTGDVPPPRPVPPVRAYGRNPAAGGASVAASARRAELLAAAVCRARDLVNTPAADMTPAALVREAREVARACGAKVTVSDRAALRRMKAGGILGVAQGSDQEPYLIKVVKPARSKKPRKRVALVGKGVTFDSGGLSMKTAAGMERMKCDMSGAAVVLSVLRAADEFAPDVEVRVYVPAAENMVSGRAVRPGDVLTTYSGKTVEVLNTDAEGRLLLADALALAAEDGPDLTVDVATLTGAVMVALGPRYSAVYSDDAGLASRIVEAGAASGEGFWRMPLAREYRPLIESPIADLKNTGGPLGGSITAALFLKEFAGTAPWAHLDVAGTAFEETGRGHVVKGATGFGVATLLRFLASL